MWDVIVKERTQGYYVFIMKVPHNTDYSELADNMIIIARNITEAEADAIMDQYPQATRPKC